MKTTIRTFTLTALLCALFSGVSRANIASADSNNYLPTFYVYAYDAKLEPKANNNWEFKPVVSDRKAPISIETVIPGNETERVYTPAVTMALALASEEG